MVTATIGGRNAPVSYAGPAPGLVQGVMQVNLSVPQGLSAGIYPVVLIVSGGGIRTQDGITLAVR